MNARALAAVGFLVVVAAEIQWAVAFLDGWGLQAALVAIAAGGFAVAAWGAWDGWDATKVGRGLMVAAAAHAVYVFSWGNPFFWSTINSASWGVGLALPVAAVGAMGGALRPGALRYGLWAAAAGATLWIVGDVQAGVYGFMVGNVLAPIGLVVAGAAAPYAAESS